MSRLIRLIVEIKTNPHQTPEQLYRALGIGKSRFYDDKNALARMGFVFEFDRSKNKFVIKKEGFLPVFDLSTGEVFSLVMAVRQLSAAGDHTLTFDAVSAIRKIIANSEPLTRDLLLGVLDVEVLKKTFQVNAAIIEELRQAQEHGIRLEILYDDFSRGRERAVQVDPYTLYFKGRALYMDAYAVEEQRVLMFRISRVNQVLRRAGNFRVRPGYNFRERHRHSYRVMTGDGPPQKVRVRFTHPTSRYIGEAHWHDSERMFHNEADGSLILELTVSDPREALQYLVMPWGAGAEVLEPAWLREEAMKTVEAMAAIYRAKGGEKK